MRVRYAVVALLFASIAFAAEQPKNLAPNPGFEEGQGERAVGWRPVRDRKHTGRLVRDESVAHTGKASLCLDNRETPKENIGARWESVALPLRGGAAVRLTAWTKTQGTGRYGAIVALHFLNEKGRIVGKAERVRKEEHDWTQLTVESAVPPGAINVVIALKVYDPNVAGWCDDVVLTVTPGAGKATPGKQADEGGPSHTLVIPDGRPGFALGAADLLARMFERASGKRLRIVEEWEAPQGPKIFLGRTQAAEKAGVDFGQQGLWCVLKASGGDLFLAGRDGSKNVEGDRGHVWQGTRKAAHIFLHDYLGVRWLIPDKKGKALNGTYVPQRKAIVFPADLNRSWRPAFDWIHVQAFEESEFFIMNTRRWGNAIYRNYGGHSYYTAVPRGKYAKDHPEYFALIKGKRDSSKNHLCISNPNVQDLIYQEMLRSADAGFSWVQLAQTDGYQPCQCESCKAIHPDPGERLWIMHNDLAKRLDKTRPAVKVVIIAYGPTSIPPKTIDRLSDNVMVEVASPNRQRLEYWGSKVPATLVYLYTWGDYHPMAFAPKTTPRMIAAQVKYLRDHAVRGIYYCGSGESWGLEGPVYYILHRILDNPDCNWQAELDDYYRAAFGRAYRPMKELYDALYARLDFMGSFYDDWPYFWSTPQHKLTEMPREPETMYTYFFPPSLLKTIQERLESARRLETDAVIRKRIDFVERAYLYVRDIAVMYHVYRAYQLDPNPLTFDMVARAIAQRNERIDAFFAQGEGCARFDGFPRMFTHHDKKFVQAGGRTYGVLGSPATWDVDRIRATNSLPGASVPRMTARKATDKIVLDGRLTEATWKAAEVGKFVEISLGKVHEPTSARVTYDDRRLYVAFECAESLAERLPGYWLAHGHDGRVYGQDCVEVFVDPVGDGAQYYHFISGGIPDSYYEEAFGIHKETYHPLSGKTDVGWNGAWDYAASVDVANKRWTVEVAIPFSTLGTQPPKPGAKWKMNLGRERFVQNANVRSEPELYCWSPNIASRQFDSPACFGEIVFSGKP